MGEEAKSRPLELAWKEDDCRRRRGASRSEEEDGEGKPCAAVESRTPPSSFGEASIAATTVREDLRDASPIASRVKERMAKQRREEGRECFSSFNSALFLPLFCWM